MTRQPAKSLSISFQYPFNRAGGRTSNVQWKYNRSMVITIITIPFVAALLWLLSIRPYCRRNGKGFTPGANVGATFWVDWQEAREISKSKGDEGMIMICRFVFWLHIPSFAVLAWSIFSL